MKQLAYMMAFLFIPCYLFYWLSVWDVFGILLCAGMLGIAVLAFVKSFKKPEPAYKTEKDA